MVLCEQCVLGSKGCSVSWSMSDGAIYNQSIDFSFLYDGGSVFSVSWCFAVCGRHGSQNKKRIYIIKKYKVACSVTHGLDPDVTPSTCNVLRAINILRVGCFRPANALPYYKSRSFDGIYKEGK